MSSPLISPNVPDWEPVLKYGERKEYHPNEIIIDEGDKVDKIYYLSKGKVKTSLITTAGMEKIFWYLSAPNVFGETPFFNEQPSTRLMTTMEACEIYCFDRNSFASWIGDHPQIMLFIYKLLAQKIRVISSQIEDLCTSEPTVRVAKLLFMLAQQNGKPLGDNRYVINLKLTHQEVANITGLHRVTISNILKTLRNEGTIEKDTQKIIINDMDRLFDLVYGQSI